MADCSSCGASIPFVRHLTDVRLANMFRGPFHRVYRCPYCKVDYSIAVGSSLLGIPVAVGIFVAWVVALSYLHVADLVALHDKSLKGAVVFCLYFVVPALIAMAIHWRYIAQLTEPRD